MMASEFMFCLQVPLVRLAQSVVRSFDRDIGTVIERLERHARAADQTAIATELLEAAEFRKETCRRQHEDLKTKCERWLRPSDTRQIHLQRVQAQLNGTCSWIKSNDDFKRWGGPESTTGRNRLLVVSGAHGCGKSVLASSIVARLENSKQHTLFFAFSSTDGSRQTSENLVRTLLWQLLREAANKESVETVHRLSLDGEPTTPELWMTFGGIASSLERPIYCVIDGVDECIDYSHNMTTMLTEVLEKCSDLRILLLGRPHVFQAHSGISTFAAIDITSAMLSKDIETFISNEIATSEILSLPEFREKVHEILKEKSDGMFLWVRLMVDDLKKSCSKSEFSERLQNLPRGLEKAYQLLFLHLSQRLDKYEQRLAQSVLAFASTSCRPLRFDELRYALALHCTPSEKAAQIIEPTLFLQPPQRVLDVTGGLVTVTEGVLRIIHSSVRDFLVRPEDQWDSEPDRAVRGFRIDIPLTHRAFAWICLDYMSLEKDEGSTLNPDMFQHTQALGDRYPLLQYATLYTFFHLNRAGSPCPNTISKIESILESTQSLLWIDHFSRLLFEEITLESQVGEFLALAERLDDADVRGRLFKIFRVKLKERNDRMRRLEKCIDPLTENLEGYLDQITGGQLATSSRRQSKGNMDPIQSVLVSSTAGPDLRNDPLDSPPDPYDPSTSVSRVIHLLQGQTSLSTNCQIELWLRLSTFLNKKTIMIDPLKALFRMILKKASGIHVFVLLAIGQFYKKIEKPREALEIYTVASRKMDHLDVPLKFKIYSYMGDCYGSLGLDLEALKCYDKAFAGLETLYGRRHPETLQTLLSIITTCVYLHRPTELLRLSDKICMEEDLVSEIDLKDNLHLHNSRYSACLATSNHERAAQAKRRLQETLKMCCEFYSKKSSVSSYFHEHMGNAYALLGEYDMAVEHFQLGFEVCQSEGVRLKSTLYFQYRIACQFRNLGRYYEAEELLETVYTRQQRLFPSNHREIRWTKKKLDRVRLDIDALNNRENDIGLDEDGLDADEWDQDQLDDDGLYEDGLDENKSDEDNVEDRHDLKGKERDEVSDEELFNDEL